MEGLLNKQIRDSISHAKKIRYYCYSPSNTNHNSNENNIKQFSFAPPLNGQVCEGEMVEVNVDPKNYFTTKICSPLDSLNNKWFINWSHNYIPDNVQRLLQLGHNFSLPSVAPTTILYEPSRTSKIISVSYILILKIQETISILHNLKNPAYYGEHLDLKIINLIKCTNKFIKNKS